MDRFGDEVEGAGIHRGADIGHIAVGRDDDGAHRRLPLAQHREQRQPVHDRHVDIEQQQLDIGLVGQDGQRFLAVVSEAEGVFLRADLAAEALFDQQLEIGFVIDGEDLGKVRHRAPP